MNSKRNEGKGIKIRCYWKVGSGINTIKKDGLGEMWEGGGERGMVEEQIRTLAAVEQRYRKAVGRGLRGTDLGTHRAPSQLVQDLENKIYVKHQGLVGAQGDKPCRCLA